jgi:hypothetical protein
VERKVEIDNEKGRNNGIGLRYSQRPKIGEKKKLIYLVSKTRYDIACPYLSRPSPLHQAKMFPDGVYLHENQKVTKFGL